MIARYGWLNSVDETCDGISGTRGLSPIVHTVGPVRCECVKFDSAVIATPYILHSSCTQRALSRRVTPKIASFHQQLHHPFHPGRCVQPNLGCASHANLARIQVCCGSASEMKQNAMHLFEFILHRMETV